MEITSKPLQPVQPEAWFARRDSLKRDGQDGGGRLIFSVQHLHGYRQVVQHALHCKSINFQINTQGRLLIEGHKRELVKDLYIVNKPSSSTTDQTKQTQTTKTTQKTKPKPTHKRGMTSYQFIGRFMQEVANLWGVFEASVSMFYNSA